MIDILVRLATLFGSLSLVSFGGSNSVLAEIEAQAVGVQHWLSAPQFSQLFALSQAAPGPSSMFSSMIGLKAAGLLGALVAISALMIPSCLVMYFGCRAWEKFRGRPWLLAFEHGMAPITVGLLSASALTVVRASDHGWVGGLITIATAALMVRTRVNPLWIMLAAGALGAAGLIES